MQALKILFVGDIVGRYGRKVLKLVLPELQKELSPDVIIVNGENAASGYGMTEKVYGEIMQTGVDAVTMGNHMFDKRDIVKCLDDCERMIRPANYPPGAPGKDHLILEKSGVKIGIINLLGRVFMPSMDCPFRTGEALAEKIRKETNIILVDMHAEATSEKCAIGYYLDGKVSAVLGTHTHVMTADEKILKGGTAFIADVGMVGAYDSVIGMNKEQIVSRFVTQMPNKFEPTLEGNGLFNAVMLTLDAASGKTREIQRIYRVVPETRIRDNAEKK